VSDYKVVVGDDGEIESDDLDLYEKPKRKRKPFRRPIRLVLLFVFGSVFFTLSAIGALVLYYLARTPDQANTSVFCPRNIEYAGTGGRYMTFQFADETSNEYSNNLYIVSIDDVSVNNIRFRDKVTSIDVSPDLAFILFTEYDQSLQSDVLYSMSYDIRLGEPKRLSEGIFPALSPDGSQVAFFRNFAYNNSVLYVINVDGTDIRRVADTYGIASPASWSPDGSKLVFSTTSQDESSTEQLHIINVDGTDEHPIWENSLSMSYPAWSPDGSRIAYISHDVYIVNVDGSDRKNITNGQLTAITNVDWSPDGMSLIFVGYSRQGYALYRVDDDGAGLRSFFCMS
jgi:hypothetical protein